MYHTGEGSVRVSWQQKPQQRQQQQQQQQEANRMVGPHFSLTGCMCGENISKLAANSGGSSSNDSTVNP